MAGPNPPASVPMAITIACGVHPISATATIRPDPSLAAAIETARAPARAPMVVGFPPNCPSCVVQRLTLCPSGAATTTSPPPGRTVIAGGRTETLCIESVVGVPIVALALIALPTIATRSGAGVAVVQVWSGSLRVEAGVSYQATSALAPSCSGASAGSAAPAVQGACASELGPAFVTDW